MPAVRRLTRSAISDSGDNDDTASPSRTLAAAPTTCVECFILGLNCLYLPGAQACVACLFAGTVCSQQQPEVVRSQTSSSTSSSSGTFITGTRTSSANSSTEVLLQTDAVRAAAAFVAENSGFTGVSASSGGGRSRTTAGFPTEADFRTAPYPGRSSGTPRQQTAVRTALSTPSAHQANYSSNGTGSIPYNPSLIPFAHAVSDCMAAFFGHYNKISGVIHRPSFEVALTGPGPREPPGTLNSQLRALYNNQVPVALFFSILTVGAFTIELYWGYSKADKLRMARVWSTRALELLLAGRGSDPVNPTGSMSDLEAIMTVVMLFEVIVPAGMAKKIIPIGEWAGKLLRSVCVDIEPGTGPLDNPNPPQNVQEWLYRDMILRSWWSLVGFDLNISYFTGRKTFMESFPRQLRRFNAPWHELYFNTPDPGLAFETMKTLFGAKPAGANFSQFLREATPELANEIAEQLIPPIFQHESSYYGLSMCNLFQMWLMDRMKRMAVNHGLKGLEAMAKPETERTYLERKLIKQMTNADEIAYAYFRALPEGLGAKMLSGDSYSFFVAAPNYFVDPAHIHYFFGVLTLLLSKGLQNRFHGGGNPDHLTLFSSPEFLKLLNVTIVMTSMLRGQLQFDPTLSVAYSVGTAVMRLATLQVALLANLPADNPGRKPLEADCATCVGYLVTHLRRSGGALPQVAVNLVKAAASVGVVVRTGQIEELDPELTTEMGTVKTEQSLADVMLTVDKIMAAWFS